MTLMSSQLHICTCVLTVLLEFVAPQGQVRAMAADKVTKTLPVSFSDVQVAMGRIRQHVHYTPMMQCSHLDSLSGYQLHFKCEMFQKTGAFKVWNCMVDQPCVHMLPLYTHQLHSITICRSWENTQQAMHLIGIHSVTYSEPSLLCIIVNSN